MDEFYLFVQKEEVTDEVRQYCDKVGIILKDYHELTSFFEGVSLKGDVLYDKRNTNFRTYKALLTKTENEGVELTRF